MVRFREPGSRFEARTAYRPRSFRSGRGEIAMKIRTNRVRFLAGIVSLVVLAILAACYAKTSVAQKAPSTTYYTHGRIYTNDRAHPWAERSEEHTSELQSHVNLVCRLLLEKKKKKT